MHSNDDLRFNMTFIQQGQILYLYGENVFESFIKEIVLKLANRTLIVS